MHLCDEEYDAFAMREDKTSTSTPPLSRLRSGDRVIDSGKLSSPCLLQRGPEGTTALVRMASHLLIFLVAVTVLAFSRLQLPHWEIAEVQESAITTDDTTLAPVAADNETSGVSTLVRARHPLHPGPRAPRVDIATYAVQAGDTLYAIAERFGISAETLMWANSMEQNPDLLRLGQQLTVLPVNGVYHTVVANDTPESIAKKYKVNVAGILDFEWNHLDPKNPILTIGQKLIVPGGIKPPVVRPVQVYSGSRPARATQGTGRFVWPTPGSITQGYKPLHKALDIGSWVGAPVKASDSGYVAVAGWSNLGYGYYIVIDHGNGFQTLYAHLSRYFVSAGESVARGRSSGWWAPPETPPVRICTLRSARTASAGTRSTTCPENGDCEVGSWRLEVGACPALCDLSLRAPRRRPHRRGSLVAR